MTDAEAADVLAIHDLLARVAHVVDHGDLDEYADLFTPDAVWATAANPTLGIEASEAQGREAIVAGAAARRAQGIQGPGTGTRHVVTTVAVRFRGRAEAEADAYWLYLTDTAGQPTVRAVGAYENDLRKEGGAWRISRRRLVQG